MDFVSKHWKSIAIITGIVLTTSTSYYLYSQQSSVKQAKPKSLTEGKGKKVEKNSSESQNVQLAKEAKDLGNKLYKEKNYKKAIQLYTQAIELDSSVPIYFSNRAACYNHLKDYENVIADCTEALNLDPLYIKALNRRASAYESLERLDEALQDFTALCVLEEFKNEATMAATDRILKTIGKEKAKLVIKEKPNKLPSDAFISAYMESFRSTSSEAKSLCDSLPATTDADIKLKQVVDFILAKQYAKADELVQSVLEEQLSKEFKVWALNLSGTFKFLKGNVAQAVEDFNKSLALDPNNIDTLIKRASVYMESGDLNKTIAEFGAAETLMKGLQIQHPDLYYHRGQVRHLTGDLEGAIVDFKKSLELDPTLVYAQIQLGVAQYKSGDVAKGIYTFKMATRKFPDRSEVYNYQGEILLDQGDHVKALENFDKAIQLQPTSSLPYINKAMLYLQSRGDAATAESLLKKAVEVDPLGDIAYGPLAQLYLSQNKIQQAVETYEEAIKVARTEQELITAISCREAALAQIKMTERYPALMKKFTPFQ